MIHIKVILVDVPNQFRLTVNDTLAAFKVAKRKFKEAGIDIQLEDIIHSDCEITEPLLEPFTALGLLRDKFIAEYTSIKPKHVYHLMAPPVVIAGTNFLAGTAGCVGCPRDRWVSASTFFLPLTLAIKTSKMQIEAVGCVMAHEIAHVFGATHTTKEDTSLMDSNLNFYNSFHYVHFTRKTKTEMINHLHKVGY